MVASSSKHFHRADTVVVTLEGDLGSSRCEGLQAACSNLQDSLRSGSIRNIVIDCSATTSFGCTALGLLLRLWKTVNRHNGHFALCGLSPLGRDILQAVQLHRLWPIYGSLIEAVYAVEHGLIDRPGQRPSLA